MSNKIRVTVWHEYRHEKKNPKVHEVYPKGMHEAIADGLRDQSDLEIRTATLDEPSHGLSQQHPFRTTPINRIIIAIRKGVARIVPCASTRNKYQARHSERQISFMPEGLAAAVTLPP